MNTKDRIKVLKAIEVLKGVSFEVGDPDEVKVSTELDRVLALLLGVTLKPWVKGGK